MPGVLGEYVRDVLAHRDSQLGGLRLDDLVDGAIGPGHDLRAVTFVSLALGHKGDHATPATEKEGYDWLLGQGCLAVDREPIDKCIDIVFDKGAIIEDGTHAELIAKQGRYWELWNSQVNGFISGKEE